MKQFKRAWLPTLLLASTLPGVASADLLISEYIEGSSDNKALEIFNGTGSPVDLADYAVKVYFNGSALPGASVPLAGTLADGEVFVFAHRDADAAILAQADHTYGGGLFNGDDAVVLSRLGQPVDVIGQVGVDPGSQWGDSAVGTQNQTLRRNEGVASGRSDGDTAFDPALEWSSAGLDSFGGLGGHGGSGGGGIALGQCGESATLISAVQGTGASSPLVGERIEVEAVVVGEFQNTATALGGFFLQEEDADQDGLDTSSEGLFVYDNGVGTDVRLGDLVRVGGVITEYYGFTELTGIDGVKVCSSGHSVTAAQPVLPFASGDAPERFEGMLVEFPQDLTVTGNYDLARYGEVELSSGRLFIPTNVVEPGSAALARQAANDLNRILLDDGSTVRNPAVIPYPAPQLGADNSLRAGTMVSGLRGVIGYGFDAYRVHPVEAPRFSDTNARSPAPELPGEGSLRVASFNVLNYFNGDGKGGGFPTDRGADTLEEFQRQREKIIAAIHAMDADIIGLMEIENDGYGPGSAIHDLVDGLNAATGADTYAFVDPATAQLGGDQIAVGIVYRSNRVHPLGPAVTLDSYPFDDSNRQPLLQAFQELSSGGTLAVAVNHFKSKGSCPNDGSLNDDQGDGQGCWNLVRTQAADALASWLAADPSGTGTEGVLVIGDLNSYARENPITTLEDAGYTDLLAGSGGGEAYSYVFAGQAGYLDHALANAALASSVTAATIWPVNADEPRALDYNTEHKSAEQINTFYRADPYRASDHDPVIVELDLPRANSAPQADFAFDTSKRHVQFTDRSTDVDGEIVRWQWMFGDGASSSEQNPRHRYTVPGEYTVTLLVEDNLGASTTIVRKVDAPDGKDTQPLAFRLHRFLSWVWVSARTKGAHGRGYRWNFGDGTVKQGTGGWHRYGQGGSYRITLVATDDTGREFSASRPVTIPHMGW
ncbi:ExeM/NucH family extracellular endonuclease [Microbulbifer sediminum]|uniref:ExeM/NucH family extracellular endonuclease n=1 Tax=Microbulbifer sediminum TaxID=2904250 RepID=UPI001F3DD4BC|nr:ExeM/NucH family extracellular endonuclease [Microbulbifer sediminum]